MFAYPYKFLIITPLVLVGLVVLLPMPIAHMLVKEHGAIEMGSVILPLITSALILWRLPKNIDNMIIIIALWFFAYREFGLGWHRPFFSFNIGRPRDYFDPSFALSEKLIAVLVIAPLLGMVLLLCWRNVPIVWQKLRTGKMETLMLINGIFYLVLAQFFELAQKYLFSSSPFAKFIFLATEEILEMFAQILFLLCTMAAINPLLLNTEGKTSWEK